MLLLTLLLACAPQDRSLPTGKATPASATATADSRAAWCPPERAARCSKAAERGLTWLAAQQTKSGSWTGIVGHKQQSSYHELNNAMSVERQRATGHGHLGVSALGGMAFLAGGHLPGRGQYSDVVSRVHDYIVGKTLESGLLTDAGTRMYSHAFATLFLAEIHGMTAEGSRKSALEKAVHMIVDCQNEHGAWRYNPFDRNADLSVTVCQLQALRAARNIGIHVPPGTIDKAMAYVRRSRVRSGRNEGQFYYKIHGAGAYSKDSQYAINAAALTAMSSAGVYEEELFDPVLRFLERNYGEVSDYYGDHYYFWYGNYYAAQGFFQHGGPRCRAFYKRLSDDLLANQRADGSWRNRVGPGDEFSTAVACILLQMPRQYLPIFQR